MELSTREALAERLREVARDGCIISQDDRLMFRAAAALLREPPTDEAVARELERAYYDRMDMHFGTIAVEFLPIEMVRAVRAAEKRAKEVV